MIRKNDPLGAGTYEWRFDWSATQSLSSASPYAIASGLLDATFGNAYVATVHGFEIAVTTRTSNPSIPGDTGHYSATFTSPWGNYPISGNSFLTTLRWGVFMTGATLTGSCDGWALSFTQLRLSTIDSSGNEVANLLTIGAQTQSGTGYDPRLNIDYYQCDSGANPNIIANSPPTCAGSFASQSTASFSGTSAILGGWRVDYGSGWTYPTIDIQTITPTFDPTCSTCQPILYPPTQTNCFNVSISSELYFNVVKTDLGIQTCTCPGGGTGPTIDLWYVDQNFRYHNTNVSLHRKDGPITAYQSHWHVQCNGVDTDNSVTGSHSYTTCAYTGISEKGVWRKYCQVTNSPGSCGVGGTAICPGGTDTSCYEFSQIDLSWPTKPSCSDNPGGSWNEQPADNRFLVSRTDGTGAYVDWWGYRLPNGNMDHGTVTVASGTHYTQCRVAYDHRLRIYAIISKDDGTLYESHSDDGGKSWSSLVSAGITSGYFATIDGKNGDVIQAAFVYDSGTTGPGKIKYVIKGKGDTAYSAVFTVKDNTGTAIEFVAGSFHMRFSDDGASRVLLTSTVNGESATSSWFSTDIFTGGTFTRFT